MFRVFLRTLLANAPRSAELTCVHIPERVVVSYMECLASPCLERVTNPVECKGLHLQKPLVALGLYEGTREMAGGRHQMRQVSQ